MLPQANGPSLRRVSNARKRSGTTDPPAELQLALFEDGPVGPAVNETHDPEACASSPSPAALAAIPCGPAQEADRDGQAPKLVQDEAGEPDIPGDPVPPDMRELLGPDEFAEISRLLGNSLGRAVWRQVREAQGEQQNTQETPLS